MIDTDNDLKKYENSTYSQVLSDQNLKSIPHLKLGVGLKGGLSFDKIQSQFQKFSAKLPKYQAYRIFSGILSKKYPLDSSVIEEESALKKTENQNNKINLFRNHLSLELIKLHHADALTIGNSVFLSPNKMDLSSDRGKALILHEIIHLVQQEREHQNDNDAKTITLSKYSEMETEAQDAERDFLRLSMHKKFNKGRNFSYNVHDHSNINIENFELDNKKDNAISTIDNLSLVHPNIAKIFKHLFMKEDFSNLINERSQTILNDNNNGTSSSKSVDKLSSLASSTSARKSGKEPIFFASEGRSVYPPAAVPVGDDLSSKILTQTSNQSKEPVDLNSLVEQVYELMSRRLILERSRRGIR